MSKTAVAIIGAGYGDEGKGLLTDAYAALNQNDSIVIRYNGGSNAGHTVTTMDGKKHVFSHIGAGTFNGVPTYLSRFFICNPLIFKKEYEVLLNTHKIKPLILIDPDSLVTTPFDIIVNQILERRRIDKHGSVGIGIDETIRRSKSACGLTFNDLHESESYLENRLRDIRDNFVPSRFLGDPISKAQDGDLYDTLHNKQLISDFISICKYMINVTETVGVDTIGIHFDDLIFEGAQGLLLSEKYYDPIDNPYVTHSYTGVKNILKILDDINGVNDFLINYVHRAYNTRHGSGPLLNEGSVSFNIKDETNTFNEFQGLLRLAPLDVDNLLDTIADDMINVPHQHQLTITCMDQIDNIVSFISDDQDMLLPEKEFVDFISNIADTLSYGQTRETIKTTDSNDLHVPF